MATARGLFLVLEGLDGAGTTTQAHRLAAEISRCGRRTLFTSEPSRGPAGSVLSLFLSRRLLLSSSLAAREGSLGRDVLALLFAADRLDHLEHEILPAITTGVHVICDRYVASSLAYQLSLDRTNLGWLREINRLAPPPDLTVFLRTPSEVCARRRSLSRLDESFFEKMEEQRRVEANYDLVFERLAAEGEPIEVVDGSPSIEAVYADLLLRLETRFPELAGEERGRDD